MSTPLLRETLKFCRRVLYAPAEPLTNGVFISFAFFRQIFLFLDCQGYLELKGSHIPGEKKHTHKHIR